MNASMTGQWSNQYEREYITAHGMEYKLGMGYHFIGSSIGYRTLEAAYEFCYRFYECGYPSANRMVDERTPAFHVTWHDTSVPCFVTGTDTAIEFWFGRDLSLEYAE